MKDDNSGIQSIEKRALHLLDRLGFSKRMEELELQPDERLAAASRMGAINPANAVNGDPEEWVRLQNRLHQVMLDFGRYRHDEKVSLVASCINYGVAVLSQHPDCPGCKRNFIATAEMLYAAGTSILQEMTWSDAQRILAAAKTQASATAFISNQASAQSLSSVATVHANLIDDVVIQLCDLKASFLSVCSDKMFDSLIRNIVVMISEIEAYRIGERPCDAAIDAVVDTRKCLFAIQYFISKEIHHGALVIQDGIVKPAVDA